MSRFSTALNSYAEKLIKIKDIIDSIDPPEHMEEDFNPMDASGGNFDDSYNMGRRHGEQELAQLIREILYANAKSSGEN
jgi:hypothetical protein